MAGYNRVVLIGNLGADPELRFTQSGTAVLNARIAVNQSFKNAQGEKQERTDWFSVTVWGKRGEALSKFLTKGQQLLVEGQLRTSSYENKEGQKVYKTEVNASDIVLLGKGKGGGESDDSSTNERVADDFGDGPSNTDEIPF